MLRLSQSLRSQQHAVNLCSYSPDESSSGGCLMREDGSIMPWFLFVVSFRVFVWKMCLKEPHTSSLKDLETFRISEDVTYRNWIACVWMRICFSPNSHFWKQERLQEVQREAWPRLHISVVIVKVGIKDYKGA